MEDRCDRGSSNPCTARVVLLATANGLTASLLVFTWLDFCSLSAGVAGVLKKGEYRVRDFGGVFVFPVRACVRTWT